MERLEHLELLERLSLHPHLLRRGHDRLDDFFIAGAAANVAMHEMFQLRFARIGILI